VNKEELKQRTKSYALRTIKLVKALPNDSVGRAIGNQLIRSGTSIAANYRAACRGRSKAEFIAKIGTVIEETDKSGLWLELIVEGGILKRGLIEPILKETNELLAIFITTSKTARDNNKK
jgi:four helix bundle protein